MAEKKLSFEQAMGRLEEIVTLLERGDRPLEEALTLFEEGTKLMKQCSLLLDKAEQKVVKLMAKGDAEPVETEFSPTERD
jgi:exodeoxyribonuclease VII small subunit